MEEQTSYIIETMRNGNFVKVTAIDPESGTEATIIGSVKATQAYLTSLAIKKLKYMMGKENQ